MPLNGACRHWTDYATLTEAGEVTFKARWVPGTLATLSWIDRDLGLSVAALAGAYAGGRLDEISGKSYVMACAQLPIEEHFKKIEESEASQQRPPPRRCLTVFPQLSGGR